MRILVLSDLHLEFADCLVPEGLHFDAAILAGDIHSRGQKAMAWARSRRGVDLDVPLVYVVGNHEFYRSTYQPELQRTREAAREMDVHLLDRDEVVLVDPANPSGPGVRVLGATLWTDFEAPVLDRFGHGEVDLERALNTANERLNDFRLIDVIAGPHGEVLPDGETPQGVRRRFTAEDSAAMHRRDRDWLAQRLAEPFDGTTIVVTHHAPSTRSVSPQFASDWLTPAFVNDLPSEFFTVPKLWVHGHTHASFDYRVGGCHVVCNPRGYMLGGATPENWLFRPDLVIDI